MLDKHTTHFPIHVRERGADVQTLKIPIIHLKFSHANTRSTSPGIYSDKSGAVGIFVRTRAIGCKRVNSRSHWRAAACLGELRRCDTNPSIMREIMFSLLLWLMNNASALVEKNKLHSAMRRHLLNVSSGASN